LADKPKGPTFGANDAAPAASPPKQRKVIIFTSPAGASPFGGYFITINMLVGLIVEGKNVFHDSRRVRMVVNSVITLLL
jgi:hypothetical protein